MTSLTLNHEPKALQASNSIPNMEPTRKQYVSLQEAYTHYNTTLFQGMLPPVLVTFQRQRKSNGYYWPDKLINRETGGTMAEIALAINHFSKRKDWAIFATLVHEMVHHWQQVYGTPSRNGYHNKEWAAKMKEVGLYPSHNGQIGGREVGPSCTHYIIPNGVFERTSAGLTASIDWNSAPDNLTLKKKQRKTTYVCPCCDAHAWGKPELEITCTVCQEEMIVKEDDTD